MDLSSKERDGIVAFSCLKWLLNNNGTQKSFSMAAAEKPEWVWAVI
jgi:hypothetical protein